MLHKSLAAHRQLLHTCHVPETKGTGLGTPEVTRRTLRHMADFLRPFTLRAFYGRAMVGTALAVPVSVDAGVPTLLSARPPRLEPGSGFNPSTEAAMRANALARPEQTQSSSAFPGHVSHGPSLPEPVVRRHVRTHCQTRTDTTLRLTRAQYRQSAEEVKVIGNALTLASYSDLGVWGEKGVWGLAIIDDATQPPRPYKERGLITLSTSVNTKILRRAGLARPECDWSQLTDSEIYPFIVAHEIGHAVDNFGWWHQLSLDREHPDVKRALAALGLINEVLADRWAWKQVCQRPMPITEYGRHNAGKIEEYIDLLTRVTGGRYAGGTRPLPGGQYRSIPQYMLATVERAKWIGPDVHPETLRKTAAYHVDYEARRGYALWRPRPSSRQVLCDIASIR